LPHPQAGVPVRRDALLATASALVVTSLASAVEATAYAQPAPNAVSAASTTSAAPAASAQQPPTPAQCTDAYVSGQHLMRSTHLLEAQAALLVCARDPCPAALRPECSQWLAEVQRAVPSIVVAARGPHGEDLRDGRVLLDGRPLLTHLDGTATDVDAGDHLLRLETAGLPPLEQHVLVREGEKARVVAFAYPPAEPAPAGALAPSSSSPSPSVAGSHSRLPAYVLGGVGVAAAASFAYFALSGLSLYDQCHSGCSSSHVDAGNRDWTAADVSFGIAVVALGVGTYFFVRPGAGASPSQLAVGGRFE
ncbi:MAG TPA: hypothetical protein VIY73_22050, partial [Polyangiaceae bacterium]